MVCRHDSSSPYTVFQETQHTFGGHLWCCNGHNTCCQETESNLALHRDISKV